jgi:putative tricarboxylic transport membrane protein
MKKWDLLSALFWLGLGGYVCYGGHEMGLGALRQPGSGFIFFWLGVIMMGLALVIFLKSLQASPPTKETNSLWSGIQWKKIAYVLVSLALYAYAFIPLGFIVSTVFLLIFLFKAIEPQRWIVAIPGAVLGALVSYLMFSVWLGCQLPRGLLEIG